MINFGTVAPGGTLYVPFHTFDSNDPSASVTLTGLAVTDIEIYKNGSVTQRSSDAGYSLLDTDGIDFDSITGVHGFSIDLSDNTDAGFYSPGDFFWVVVSSVTVDAATISFVAGTFKIGYPGALLEGFAQSGTSTTVVLAASGPSATNDFYNGQIVAIVGGTGEGQARLISDYTGASKTVTIDGDNWVQNPDSTSVYAILPFGAALLTGASIADAVLDEALSGHTTAGTLGKAVTDIETDATAILVDTGTTLDGKIDTIDTVVDAILADTGTDGVVVAGTLDVNAVQISGSTTAANNLEASALGIVPGACEGTPSTTVIQTDLAEATDDHYIGRVIVFTSGNAAGEATDITDYTGLTGTVTVTALTTAPAASDTFVIV
jgi:hypothetical protein